VSGQADLADQEVWGHEADLLTWGDAGCNRTPEEAVRGVERVPHIAGPALTPRERSLLYVVSKPQDGDSIALGTPGAKSGLSGQPASPADPF